MKIIAFIMAVMVLVLSCMPCMDGTFAMNSSKAVAKISTSPNQQEHSDNDNCSPFCTCNCCSGFTFLFSSIKIGHTFYATAKLYSAYLSSSAIEISLPIWQPPQLG